MRRHPIPPPQQPLRPQPDVELEGHAPASRTSGSEARTILVAFATLLAAACGLQDVAAAGTALEDAGYEAHELRLESGGELTAELERSGEPIEDAHFEQAAAIIWENMHDTVVEAEIRMRDPEGSDRVENFTAEQMREFSESA